MTAIKYTQINPSPSKCRIISTQTEKKLFKFHWYVEYMLIGMAALIAIVKTTDIFLFKLPEYFLTINLDFLTAFLGVIIGLTLARHHSKKLYRNI